MQARRTTRRLLIAAAALTIALLFTMAIGFTTPGALCRGHYAVGADKACLQWAWSSDDLVNQGPAWKIGPGGQIMLGPLSRWRPTISRASASITSPPAPPVVYTISILYIPLWPWASLCGIATAILARRFRNLVPAGHCRNCAYDLRGLTADRCPECGRPIQSAIARVMSILKRRRTPAPAAAPAAA